MATNKFSYLSLLLLIVFTPSLLPIISGQMIPCISGICTDSTPCNVACISKGYKGGVCVRMDFSSTTGACCCNPNFKSQESFKSDNVLITN
ncbi:PREDICTED: putative defensin-like protein 83 [Camelina sativa]|uniref:Defensin-like protein 83 n=1 Tax=Camelina sativa TaxID=90675 RepID=A0ABM1R963_CAMSA|nr:PREDICTED: putative defensin-like protein 83 [Camelina sativa]